MPHNWARRGLVGLGVTVAVVLFAPIADAAQQAASPATRQARLAFWRGGEGHEELWVAARDGSAPHRLLAVAESLTTTVGFSPKADLLAWWTVLREEKGRQVYGLRVCPLTGGAPKTIFQDRQADYREEDAPEFTPDGRFIVFGRSAGEFGGGDEIRDWGLWQIGVDGQHLQRLTKGLGARGGSRSPKLSPDGQTIAFYSYEVEEASRLCFVSRAGGKVRRTQVWMHDFVWSPVGDFVVVAQSGEDDPYTDRLASYDLRTGKLTGLTKNHGQTSDHPTFSPDGRYLAYGLTVGEKAWITVLQLRPGRAPAQIAKVAASPPPGPFAWSPTGDRLFFTDRAAPPDATLAIWSMRPDGADRQVVLKNDALAGIVWTP
jgi:Tol biopolymer transport system component